eukprot:TRINITY_DN93988_c0_g1_i1.p1 TRINITY_DN93988_c0_g1~~TRINITY_DN93988_c0_g1_i1.p1  ORF type:complete len:350 (+),score=68.21 TRINITY_DN93988_c0_g1_i1:56-1105(+)
MGNSVAMCGKALTCDPDFECDDSDLRSRISTMNEIRRPTEEDISKPQLALRVAYAPIEDSLGASRSPFSEGDEVAIAKIMRVPQWEALNWRQERTAKQHAAMDGKRNWPGPEESRFSTPQRFWGAKVVASDGKGGFEEHWCLLQVALATPDRDMDKVRHIVEDAGHVASYAHRFNSHVVRTCGDGNPEAVPSIRVAAPVACFVLNSGLEEIANPGEAVTITPLSSNQIRKMVFEGGEDFLELPQAFFHYVAWTSGGKEMVADLQGIHDNEDIVLVDPCILRHCPPTVVDLLSTLTPGDMDTVADPSMDRFNLWHPRCGQICKSFDPQRRTANTRKACGLSLPNCGVGGA